MQWSSLGIQTIREDNHGILVRAGYRTGGPASQSAWLPLGTRSLARIQTLASGSGDWGSVLAQCGLPFTRAGISVAIESEDGNDTIVHCGAKGTGYASLLETAVSRPAAPSIEDPPEECPPEAFATPGVKTIAQIAKFSGLPETSQIKSLVVMADGQMILVLLRGDHQMSPVKFASVTKASAIRQATAEEIQRKFGAEAGSLGPIGVAGVRIIADDALRNRRNMISGANRTDFHLRHVTPEKDFTCEFADLRLAAPGDTSITGDLPLEFARAVIINNASDVLEAVAAMDKDGLLLPPAIAPFDVLLTPVHSDHLAAARQLEAALSGLEVLIDDRDARPGVKFKDADLIGIPWRVNLGKKLIEGKVEIVERAGSRTIQEVALDQVPVFFSDLHTPR